MKSKKGLMVRTIILLALFLALLIIVFFALYKIYGGTFLPWANNLPNFLWGDKKIEPSQIFRYNMQTGEVQYYDGVQAVSFKNEGFIDIEDKRIQHFPIARALYTFYFQGKELPKTVKLENNRPSGSEWVYTRGEFSITEIENYGDIKILYYFYFPDKTEIPTPDYYKLTPNNILLKRTTGESKTDISKRDIKDTYEYGGRSDLFNNRILINENTIKSLYAKGDISRETYNRLNEINYLSLPFHIESIEQFNGDENSMIELKNIIDSERTEKTDYVLFRIKREDDDVTYRFFYKKEPLEIKREPLEIYWNIKEEGIITKTTSVIIQVHIETDDEYVELPRNEIKGAEQEIIQKVSAWRASLLEEPVEIPVFDPKTGEQKESIKTCVEQVDYYLVVDLSKPSDTCP